MIDKVEAMIEPGTHFRGVLRVTDWDAQRDDFACSTVRSSKFYRAVIDLRPFGHDAMLHYEQKRYKSHKIEMFETGKKGMAEIHGILDRIVDADPAKCRLGRVDLAADVQDVSLGWFRTHAYVQYKQFLCAHWKHVDEENSEMGKKVYQGLYYGKRPSCIRVYNKVEERVSHYELWKRRETRKAKKVWEAHDEKQRAPLVLPEFIPVGEWLKHEFPYLIPSVADRFPVVTRVENQYGGRVPEQLQTMGDLRANVLDYNPFARMKLLQPGGPVPSAFDRDRFGNYRFTITEWLAYSYVREHLGTANSWESQSAAELWSILNRDRNGKRYLERMREFLPPMDGEDGSRSITESDLYECYRDSVSRQLAA